MSAIRIEEWLPKRPDVLVKGILLRQYDVPEDLPLLDQDILEVSLPDEVTITVGWFPENSPDGRFVIRMFRDRKNSRTMEQPPVEAKTPHDVVSSLGNMVKRFLSLPRQSFASCASGGSVAVYLGDTKSRIYHFA